MSLVRWAIRLALLCPVMLPLAAADAQAVVRFVAATGRDDAPCTRARPCRSLERAITRTPAGGEVQILDSGFYGRNVVVTKSLTISAVGVTATVGAGGGGNGMTIGSGQAIVVVLRGLQLRGGATTADGIRVTGQTALHVKDSIIEGFGGHGISLTLSNGELFVSDSVSRENGGDGLYSGSASAAKLTIDSSRFENNGDDGLDIDVAQSSVTRTIISGNTDDGVDLTAGKMNVTWTTSANNGGDGYRSSANGADLTLEYSVARGNGGAGLFVTVSGDARISNSVFTDNDIGLVNEGTIETRLNNISEGNVSADAVTTVPLTEIEPM